MIGFAKKTLLIGVGNTSHEAEGGLSTELNDPDAERVGVEG